MYCNSPQKDKELWSWNKKIPVLPKNNNMKEEKLKLFYDLMEEEKVYMDPSLSFDRICSWMDVVPDDMDSYLMYFLGYTGDDILKVYRGEIALHFIEKYGIKL